MPDNSGFNFKYDRTLKDILKYKMVSDLFIFLLPTAFGCITNRK